MKLKNKKTGEIIEFDAILPIKDVVGDSVAHLEYNSLAELNEEWEDCNKDDSYWYIIEDGTLGRINLSWDTPEQIENHKSIGNYFETNEEAEKAVEKLKAWKQLKDNCNFRFNGLERDERGRLTGVKVEFDKAQVTFDTAKRCYEILTLLFGGEE